MACLFTPVGPNVADGSVLVVRPSSLASADEVIE